MRRLWECKADELNTNQGGAPSIHPRRPLRPARGVDPPYLPASYHSRTLPEASPISDETNFRPSCVDAPLNRTIASASADRRVDKAHKSRTDSVQAAAAQAKRHRIHP